MRAILFVLLIGGACAAADYPTDEQFAAACAIYGVKTYVEIARIYLQAPAIDEAELVRVYGADWRWKIL